jgi:hypothetical protein
MVRSEPLLTVALLVMAASCNRNPDDDRTKAAAARRSAHEQSDKAHNETMDLAGAPWNEAGSPDSENKGESP